MTDLFYMVLISFLPVSPFILLLFAMELYLPKTKDMRGEDNAESR